jgi:hypothetical protein
LKKIFILAVASLLLISTFTIIPPQVKAETGEELLNTHSPESVTTYMVPPQPGKILLLDDLGQPGFEGKRALDRFGYTYTHVSPTEFATVDLYQYDVIFVAWLPSQAEVDALNARKSDIADYIRSGGGIVVNGEWRCAWGVINPYSFLPVTFDTGPCEWCHTNGVHIVDPTHPLVSGLTDDLLSPWDNSVHGRITVWPTEATVVTIATAWNTPHILAMEYGAGRIVVAASDPEYHVVYGPGYGPWQLLYNELSWACRRVPVPPKFKKGDIVRATVDGLRVRNDELTDIIGKVYAGYGGEILEGPKIGDVDGVKYTFWKVEWKWRIVEVSPGQWDCKAPLAEKITGWCAEDWLLRNDVYWLAKTITNEAGGETEQEQIAVGWTVKNRLLNPKKYGKDIQEIVVRGYVPHWVVPHKEPTNPEIVRRAERILAGEIHDPTGGATSFFSPKSQAPPYGPYPVPLDPEKRVAYYAWWAKPIRGWEKVTVVDPVTGEERQIIREVRVGKGPSTDTLRYVDDGWKILTFDTIRYRTATADGKFYEYKWRPLEGFNNWNFMFFWDCFERIKVSAGSSIELRVYDSEGRVTGLVNGVILTEIPDSEYFDNTVVINFPVEAYQYEVVGTNQDSYNLIITAIAKDENITFIAVDIPTSPNTIHQYIVNWVALSMGEEGVILQIDSDGDGVFEQSLTSDKELTYNEFMLQTATTIDFDPNTLNLKSKGSLTTVYIELPEGYDVSQIDVSSIFLNSTVPALAMPTKIGDYDGDGIPDLMVKFDRASVVALFAGKTVPGNYVIEVTGAWAGIRFKGTITIRIISPP